MTSKLNTCHVNYKLYIGGSGGLKILFYSLMTTVYFHKREGECARLSDTRESHIIQRERDWNYTTHLKQKKTR